MSRALVRGLAPTTATEAGEKKPLTPVLRDSITQTPDKLRPGRASRRWR